MPRLIVTLSCIVLAVGAASAANAAGRGGAPGGSMGFGPARGFAAPPMRGARAFRGEHPRRMFGHGSPGRPHRYARGGGYGAPWPWYDSDAQAGGVTVIVRQEPPPIVDPYSFENLIARTGIRPAPTPEPVIYRLEGPRDRPTTRVIRIGADLEQSGHGERRARSRVGQNRIASAETGAVLLRVPAR